MGQKSGKKPSFPKIPDRGLYTEASRQKRLAFIREVTQAPVTQVAQMSYDPKKLMSNVEALIGTVEIPVGIAGPLLVNGQHAKGLFFTPIATSEGALVASMTRGATAISRSGGVNTHVIRQRMLRVPLFILNDMESACLFSRWVDEHFDEIKAQTKLYSNYADLQSIEPHVLGKSVHLRFIYETGDAAGQNMTTTCTWQTCLWLIEQMKVFPKMTFENFLIEANLSNDKKVTYQSFLQGRGTAVMAECFLPDNIVKRVLKVTPEQMCKAYHGFVTGSVAAGMIGININIANAIAGIFTATGQDIACVHECSIGQLNLERMRGDKKGIYASLTLPSLIVGTVGGGTNLPQQKECLEILGCSGQGNARKFAEIIAGFCLSLDLSTLAAIASGQFAASHERLGRNRPIDWLKLGELNQAFFTPGLQRVLDDDKLKITSVERLPDELSGSSIITELTGHQINKVVGHFPFRLRYEANQTSGTRDVIVKVKPLDSEVILMLNSMAAMCDVRLAQEYARFKNKTGFANCHVKELAVMSQQDPRFTEHAPLVYDTYQQVDREAYVIVLEYMQDMVLMDTAGDVSAWQKPHIEAALSGLAQLHSIWYGREDELKQQAWLGEYPTRESRLEMVRLWEMLAVHASEEFPEWFTQDDLTAYIHFVYDIENWWTPLESAKKTLIHHDFNPRNIALRQTDEGLRLCAYDWELATLHLPQYDLAEFLTFTLNSETPKSEVDYYIEYHRQQLEKATQTSIDAHEWRRNYRYCLDDFMISRLSLYLMAHTFRHYDFMERIMSTFRHLLSIEQSLDLQA